MVDKRPIGYIPGKGNPLDKKPVKSKIYDNVQAKLDTGYTVKHIEVMSDKAVSKRKGELFKRIKPSTLAKLLQMDKNQESIYKINSTAPEDQSYSVKNFNNNDDAQSMISSATQKTNQTHFTAVTYATETLGISENSQFLLLDLREPEDFELYHIKEAVNFPAPNIARDKFLPDIYNFKNKLERLIIIYHVDERNGINPSTLFFEKGFENVFLISGGVEEFLNQYPELMEGKKVPPPKKKAEPKKVIVKRSNYMESPETGDIKKTGLERNPDSLEASVKGDNESIVSGISKKSTLSKMTSASAKTGLTSKSQKASSTTLKK